MAPERRVFADSYRVRVPGKWVLAGEHSVLQGGSAVALPHPEFSLELEFEPGEPSARTLLIDPPDASAVLPDLLAAAGRELFAGRPNGWRDPVGSLRIRSSIPIGAGLGSSAALCVAVARWLGEPQNLSRPRIFELARSLEHRFHGRSSGMDVAATLAAEPIRFSMKEGAQPLGSRALPRFTFHDTGLRCRTNDCVARVSGLRERDPARGAELDFKMDQASRWAAEGLTELDVDRAGSLGKLARAMDLSHACFEGWGLLPPEAVAIRDRLLSEGALAAKLTGAGGGGVVVALWG